MLSGQRAWPQSEIDRRDIKVYYPRSDAISRGGRVKIIATAADVRAHQRRTNRPLTLHLISEMQEVGRDRI